MTSAFPSPPSPAEFNEYVQKAFAALGKDGDHRLAEPFLRTVNAWMPELMPEANSEMLTVVDHLLQRCAMNAANSDEPLPHDLQIIREAALQTFARDVRPVLSRYGTLAPTLGTVQDLIADADMGMPATSSALLLPDAADVERHYFPEERWGVLRATGTGTFRFLPRPMALRHPRISHGVFLGSTYWNNWAHFLTEILPRVLLAAEDPSTADWPLLISGRRLRFAERLTNALLNRPRAIVPLEGRTQVDEARIITSVANMPYENRGLASPRPGETVFHPEALQLIRQRTWERLGITGQNAGRRIYVTRTSPMRRLINAAEVQALCESRGFFAITPEQVDPILQAALFAEAEMIIGPSGAGLANMIFAPAGCRVVSLSYPSVEGNHDYWPAIGAALGHDVQEWQGGIPIPNEERHPAHLDSRYPLDQLAASLDAWIGS